MNAKASLKTWRKSFEPIEPRYGLFSDQRGDPIRMNRRRTFTLRVTFWWLFVAGATMAVLRALEPAPPGAGVFVVVLLMALCAVVIWRPQTIR